jgi:tetratricopeptide (TPR) repeat protein
MTHSDDVAHLAECSACRQRFAANVLPFDPAARRNREREFSSIASKLERERDESSDVVARYLRDTPYEEWSRLAEMPDLRNNAALEQMSEEVRRRLDRNSMDALAVANVATSISESLHPSAYPAIVMAQLRSTAWRDRANALRYASRYEEALQSIERAESVLQQFESLGYDRAVVHLVKGMTLAQIGRFDEAHAVLSECRTIFRAHNDARRYQQAALAEGSALYEAARYAEARLVFEDLLKTALDLEIQAHIHNNLGYCATQLNDFVPANIHFSEAIAKFTDLGFTTEVPRTERGAGLVFIARGQTATGIDHLDSARRAFRAAGMVEDAALCALHIAAVFVERGDDSEARALIQTVADELEAAGLDKNAIAAVVRLRDAIDMDDATVETVRTVHALIEGLRDSVHESAN